VYITAAEIANNNKMKEKTETDSMWFTIPTPPCFPAHHLYALIARPGAEPTTTTTLLPLPISNIFLLSYSQQNF